MDLLKDFKLFAKDKGISSSVIDDVIKSTNTITPMVVEERQRNMQVVDVYSMLMADRIIYFGDEFNETSCNIAIAQLLYLDSVDNRDISIYINSGGGSIVDGLGLIDTINLINSNVNTVCVGMSASMGAVLLSCGNKGNRFVLPHGRVMIHQPSTTMKGKYNDIRIEYEQLERCKHDIYSILAENMGKPYEEIEEICSKDTWYIGQEAVDIGIVDAVVSKKDSQLNN